jgi:hypothetical protein
VAKVQTVGGIDPSSRRLAITTTDRDADPDEFDITIIELPGEGDHPANCDVAFVGMIEYVMKIRERTGQSPRLYLEAPVMGVGGPGATIPQVFVSGAVLAAAGETDCKITLVNNKTWKKRVLGNGNINKDNTAVEMKRVWKEFWIAVPVLEKGEFKGKKDLDIIDSGGLNRFGWWNVGLTERIQKRRTGG